ncbi:D-aminoacid aminotransferase-like PLP-dependent enzymes superfamily protein [Striga hermonthica]|uniref:D-aminoacid aminotransferase-like PLP-dependent enzymes superfamily protein n=1 Tax=Striga hermonthica TaxID=68872 RepID=A0A9N7RBL2_STRHE|nr:D-aminoacid aminotransferase-like PLP-dependent enzymes superfamily protein [Striga hermonthica]
MGLTSLPSRSRTIFFNFSQRCLFTVAGKPNPTAAPYSVVFRSLSTSRAASFLHRDHGFVLSSLSRCVSSMSSSAASTVWRSDAVNGQENVGRLEEEEEEEEDDGVGETSKATIPVRAFLFSTSVDLRSLVEHNKQNFIPPSSRMTNYVVLRFGDFNPLPNGSMDSSLCGSQCCYIVVFQYGSIVLFNVCDHEVDDYLKIVKRHASGLLPEMKKDEYEVRENPTLHTWMQGGLDYIMLQYLNIDGIRTIGSVLGQSIALDYYVRQVDGMVGEFTDINREMEKTGNFTMERKKLFQLVGKANSNLADVILKLGLFERKSKKTDRGATKTMASSVDASGEPIPTSSLLMAASKHIGSRCRAENVAFLKCKKDDPNPEKCLDKGRQVTQCVFNLLRDLHQMCNKELDSFLLRNGVVLPSADTPPVAAFLEAHSGAYTTTRTHNNGSKILFWERHLLRLSNSFMLLLKDNPEFVLRDHENLALQYWELSSRKMMWDSLIRCLVNDSMGKMMSFASSERKSGEELAVTTLLCVNTQNLQLLDGDYSEGDISEVLDVYLHVGGYVPPVFGVLENAARLAVVGRGRNFAGAKYSEWVRLRKHLEKLRPPSVTELLLSNDGDRILEGSLTNFFVVCLKEKHRDGKNEYLRSIEVQTAPLSEGVLPGVLREVITDICLKTGIPFREVSPSWSDRELWTEAFVTNSLRILQHVESIRAPNVWKCIESKTWEEITWVEKKFEGGPGKITTMLQKEVLRKAESEAFSISSF